MARSRTTKKLAQRIDLNYFKRATPLKRAKLWLSVAMPALALLWIGWHASAGDSRVYSSGRMSEAHAVLEKECSVCHLQQAGMFSAKASDEACVRCHAGPPHHEAQTRLLSCTTCHTEHRGRIDLKAASDKACALCHADLKTKDGLLRVAAHLSSFEGDHPQFAAMREDVRDPGTIKVNHALHMKPIRQGPLGPNVQLECADCHRPYVDRYNTRWKLDVPAGFTPQYASAVYLPGTPQPEQNGWQRKRDLAAGTPERPLSIRARMDAPLFAVDCAGCHSLQFDKRFSEGVPHDQPQVVHAFVVKKFAGYIAQHPAELRESHDADRGLTGRPLPPRVRVLSPQEWVAEKTKDAEDLLWRKTCKQCHELGAGAQGSWPEARRSEVKVAGWLPTVAPARFTPVWMPHAKFDHDAHRGFSCVNCHQKALTSTESSEVLLPGIATCRTCHAPGPEHVESRCFECHTYHGGKGERTNSTFTLPALKSAQ